MQHDSKTFAVVAAIVAAVGAAACGGAAAGGGPADAVTVPVEPAAPAAMAMGTTGFPGVDWGDTRDAVRADYPAATADGDALTVVQAHGGRDAAITFQFTGDQLIAIGVAWPDEFASFDACAEAFQAVRAELATALGGSSEDNLAAYWTTATASATLSCDTDDGEHASLSMSYTLPEE